MGPGVNSLVKRVAEKSRLVTAIRWKNIPIAVLFFYGRYRKLTY